MKIILLSALALFIPATPIALHYHHTRQIAGVIYAEAGPTCSPEERLLVATTIANRASYFHSSPHSSTVLSAYTKPRSPSHSNPAWSQCLALARNLPTPTDTVYFFHDRRRSSPPKGWGRPVISTTHFTFYERPTTHH